MSLGSSEAYNGRTTRREICWAPGREECPLSGDAQKTKAELIAELDALREKIRESTGERARQTLRESEER